MGLMSFVCGAVSACVSVVSSLGSALSSFANGISAVIGAISTALPKLGEALGQFANALLKGLGILKPDEDIEDHGERALQAAEQGITADKFDDFDDYVAALRSFELDPDKAEKRSRAEKLSAGIGVGTVALEKKFEQEPGALNGIWLLPLSNPDYFTAARVGDLVSEGKFSGDIFAYLERRLSVGDGHRFETSLATASSIEDKPALFQALDKACDGWRDIQAQVAQTNEK
ncbi:hypothetical protein Q7I35_09920 [Aeromonas allosaccharophila]|uniref:hypothetical protein n=1 Tax=Aeromonas TaxID=642 RepID=UPI0015DC0891|nr:MULTISPECIES: hypothetical protein [Aeromonas]MCE9950698.1 hypothetical protein [Aeromonas allosaccharophila]BBU04604.1 hypothetical protein WP9W18E04_19430 [Aeromonas veronii]